MSTSKDCNENDMGFHCCAIGQTIGKYAYIYLTNEGNLDRKKQMSMIQGKLTTRIQEQPDSGLQIIASGCIRRFASIKEIRQNMDIY